jgi:hypothetical protein
LSFAHRPVVVVVAVAVFADAVGGVDVVAKVSAAATDDVVAVVVAAAVFVVVALEIVVALYSPRCPVASG